MDDTQVGYNTKIYPEATTPRDRTLVSSAVDQLFKELDVAGESFSRLQNRCELITRPEGPEVSMKDGGIAAGSPEFSTLQNKLWSAVGLLGELTRRINNTIERVDL